jgi:hypothetical protein
MKGILSEIELHTLRGRLNAGIDNKARRGELVVPLPVGCVRLPDGVVVKDPDLQVQETVALIFRMFLDLRSCGRVARSLRQHGLLIPCRRQGEERARFVEPKSAAVHRMLRTPAYAGTFTFGRTRSERKTDPQRPGWRSLRQPLDKWRVVLKDRFAGYVDWHTFLRIQSILDNNYAHYRRGDRRGVLREGAALLAGICFCGHCGHAMPLAYSSTARTSAAACGPRKDRPRSTTPSAVTSSTRACRTPSSRRCAPSSWSCARSLPPSERRFPRCGRRCPRQAARRSCAAWSTRSCFDACPAER